MLFHFFEYFCRFLQLKVHKCVLFCGRLRVFLDGCWSCCRLRVVDWDSVISHVGLGPLGSICSAWSRVTGLFSYMYFLILQFWPFDASAPKGCPRRIVLWVVHPSIHLYTPELINTYYEGQRSLTFG